MFVDVCKIVERGGGGGRGREREIHRRESLQATKSTETAAGSVFLV